MIDLPPQIFESFVPISAGIIVSLINKYIINGACCEPAPPEEIDSENDSDDTQCTLNKDLVCKRHRDHANKEHSWILWLGDFTGGALHFDDGSKIEGKGVWHKINGHLHHWNDPHEGTKYSIVLYRRTRKPKTNNMVAAKRAKRESLHLKSNLSSSLDDRPATTSI